MVHSTPEFAAAPSRQPAHTETSSDLGKKLHPSVHSQEQTLLSSPVAQSLTLAMRVVYGYLLVSNE
jgi:hypothetical protein